MVFFLHILMKFSFNFIFSRKRDHEKQPPAISSCSAQGRGSPLPKWWGEAVYVPSLISLSFYLLMSPMHFIILCRRKLLNIFIFYLALFLSPAQILPTPCACSIHRFSEVWPWEGILLGSSAYWTVKWPSKLMPRSFYTPKKGTATPSVTLCPPQRAQDLGLKF